MFFESTCFTMLFQLMLFHNFRKSQTTENVSISKAAMAHQSIWIVQLFFIRCNESFKLTIICWSSNNTIRLYVVHSKCAHSRPMQFICFTSPSHIKIHITMDSTWFTTFYCSDAKARFIGIFPIIMIARLVFNIDARHLPRLMQSYQFPLLLRWDLRENVRFILLRI